MPAPGPAEAPDEKVHRDEHDLKTQVEEEDVAGSEDNNDEGRDLLLAYWALSGPEARKQAIELADTVPIDDGFSRSLLLAWLYALKE